MAKRTSRLFTSRSDVLSTTAPDGEAGGSASSKLTGIGVLRALQTGCRCRRFLDQFALLHHHHMVGIAPHDGQVMGNQQDGHPQFFLKAPEQFQYLLLDGDIKGCCGLVCDQQVRLVGQGHGDHHPLLLAAGELMRVARQPLLRRGNADQLQ